jgi:hypothetical protein
MTPEDIPGQAVRIEIEDLFPWLLAVEPLLREPRRPRPAPVRDDARDGLPEAA